jgi:hypothetical protein
MMLPNLDIEEMSLEGLTGHDGNALLPSSYEMISKVEEIDDRFGGGDLYRKGLLFPARERAR